MVCLLKVFVHLDIDQFLSYLQLIFFSRSIELLTKIIFIYSEKNLLDHRKGFLLMVNHDDDEFESEDYEEQNQSVLDFHN